MPDRNAVGHGSSPAAFACPSGHRVRAGLTDDVATALRLAVRPGILDVRARFTGLDRHDGDDSCHVDLWPEAASAPRGVRVLRTWPP